MRRTTLRGGWLPFIVFLLLSATVPAPPLAAQAAPSFAAEPALDTFRTAWVTAIRDKDAGALSRLVVDSVVMTRNGPALVGRDAFRAFYANLFGGMSGPNPYVVYPRDVKVVGEYAEETGDFGPEGGPRVGSYLLKLRRGADRNWRVVLQKNWRNQQ